MFAPPQEELDHAGFTPPEEELDEAPKKELAPEGFWGTAGRELASKIAPAAGAAAGGLGAGLLAIESGPGAIAADIAAGTAAGAGTEALQRKVMGGAWSDQNLAQMEANAKAHPHAAMIGSALPFILSALGGGVPRALKSGAEKVGAGLGEKVAAGELAENVAKDQTAAAFKKAEESFLPSATQFARAGGASEAEKQVDTDKFDPASLAGETGMGFATGGLMHFIPGADLHSAKTWGELAQKALYNVTGKAAGDAATMVLANKAYNHFVKGEPFTMSDVVGDSAASTIDFALLNALHAGIAAKGFGKTMADRAKAQAEENQKQEALRNAQGSLDKIDSDVAPAAKAAAQEVVNQAAVAPPKEPEGKEASEEEPTPVPGPTIIPTLNKEGPAGVSSKLVIPPPEGTDQPGYRHHASPEHQEYDQLGGWKLHLHVDPQNYKAVDSWLDKNHPGLYKLLQGGEPGSKDFTVYVGDKDKAQALADKANTEIGGLLNSSENAVNEGDTAFNDKVASRFDVQKTGSQKEVPWIHYGVNGIPFDEDAAMHGWYSNWGPRPDPSTPEGRADIRQKNAERIHDELTKKYGERYTGFRPEISSLDAIPGDKVSFEGRNGTLVAVRSNPLSQGKTRTAHVKIDDGTELLFNAENPDLKYSRSLVKPITPVVSEPATKLAPETPPDASEPSLATTTLKTPSNASQPPSAVITPETPSDTLEALERAKEQVSGDLTPEERSQIEAMVRKRHAGKPPQVVDELAEDAVQATRRSALSQKYAPKLQEIAEQIKGISGPGKAPEPSTEPGNFPSALSGADLAKRQPAPKEKAVSEAEPPRIEGASFQDSEGKVHTAGDHVTAAALAGVEAPMDRPGRETAPYGFKLENQEKPLSRKEATELVRGTKPTTSGKAKPHPQYRSGKEVGGRRKLLHSNEVRMEHQMSLKEVPEFREEISGKEPIPSQAKFEAAYQKDFLKDHGETREEFLNRKICGG